MVYEKKKKYCLNKQKKDKITNQTAFLRKIKHRWFSKS